MSLIAKKVRPSKLISALLYVQSLALFGIFSMNLLPLFIRKLGSEINPTFIFSDEVASILVAASLFMTARGVKLRRRRAWIFATTLQIVLIATSLIRSGYFIFHGHENLHLILKAMGISHLLLQFLILVLLVRFRAIFKTIVDPLTRRQAIIFFLRNSIFVTLLGLLIVYFGSNSFTSSVNLTQALEITFKGLVGISGPNSFVSTHLRERLEFFLGGLGLLLALTSLAKFLKPSHRTTSLSKENAVLIRQLLEKYPENDSLSYFALRDNKTLVWAKNMKAAIPYSIVNGVMITTGDPVGDKESWPSAIAAFLLEAEMHAWVPAIYGCSEIAGEIWVRESDFEVLEIGDEAILDIAQFTLEGPSMKNIRQTINRINRLDYTAQSSFVRDLDHDVQTKLASSIQDWRKSQTERGFSMALGRFCDSLDPDCLITWAQHGDEIMAMLQFVPWGSSSLSLDLMRRSPESETGVNELMIQQTIAFAAERNFKQISLNFASFRSIFERGKKLGAGPITRLNHKILLFLSRFFQMESLYRFNSKFQPTWKPRYVVFPGVGNLVKIGFAILKIEAFIPDANTFFRIGRKIK